jgi:hypothetical protein
MKNIFLFTLQILYFKILFLFYLTTKNDYIWLPLKKATIALFLPIKWLIDNNQCKMSGMDSGAELIGNGWQECASWLIRCGALRADHKANWPTATAVDLAYILRDGVLLCNLLNTIEAGCIDSKDVNQKPQMAQFLCLRNINAFLSACTSVFGLSESDLFEPSMLFDLSNFHKVLCTLSVLSNSVLFNNKGIE